MTPQPSLSDMLATPLTHALRSALVAVKDARTTEDLLFLERWEIAPNPGTVDALRAAQLRRANPDLAAAIRAELKTRKK